MYSSLLFTFRNSNVFGRSALYSFTYALLRKVKEELASLDASVVGVMSPGFSL